MNFLQPSAINRESVRDLLPPRRDDGDKWSHGSALLIAGSRGMCGAASFAARAAYRVGCGYLKLATPAGESATLQILSPDAVLIPLGKASSFHLDLHSLEQLLALSTSSNAWAIGPGLSRDGEVGELVRQFVCSAEGTGVVDADALNAFAGKAELFRKCRAQLILSPHTKEWERLFQEPLPQEIDARRECVSRRAKEIGQTIISKGATTVIALPDGEVWEYRGGCSALAKAGSGDSLTGALLGLSAQGATTSEAARLAVWLHGEAGVIGAQRHTPYGLLPQELPDLLSESMLRLLTEDETSSLLAVDPLQRYH